MVGVVGSSPIAPTTLKRPFSPLKRAFFICRGKRCCGHSVDINGGPTMTAPFRLVDSSELDDLMLSFLRSAECKEKVLCMPLGNYAAFDTSSDEYKVLMFLRRFAPANVSLFLRGLHPGFQAECHFRFGKTDDFLALGRNDDDALDHVLSLNLGFRGKPGSCAACSG